MQPILTHFAEEACLKQAILAKVRGNVTFFTYTIVFTRENGAFLIRKGPSAEGDARLGCSNSFRLSIGSLYLIRDIISRN